MRKLWKILPLICALMLCLAVGASAGVDVSGGSNHSVAGISVTTDTNGYHTVTLTSDVPDGTDLTVSCYTTLVIDEEVTLASLTIKNVNVNVNGSGRYLDITAKNASVDTLTLHGALSMDASSYAVLVTVKENVTLNLSEFSGGTDGSTFTVDNGAIVNFESQSSALNFGASGGVGGVLNVNGVLNVKSGESAAISIGTFKIGATGVVSIDGDSYSESGNTALKINGTDSTYKNVFSIAAGGKLEVTNVDLILKIATDTEQCTVSNIISLPENYLPSDCELVEVVDDSSYEEYRYNYYAYTIAEKDATLSFNRNNDTTITGALGAPFSLPVATVTFDANGGAWDDSHTIATNMNGTVPFPTSNPTYEGHTFNGWYTATSGGDEVTASTTFTESTTVYAQWTADAQGGVADNAEDDDARKVAMRTGADDDAYEVTLDDEDALQADKDEAAYLEKVTLTTDADAGYTVADITVLDDGDNQIAVYDSGDGVFYFRMPSDDVTVYLDAKDTVTYLFDDVSSADWYYEGVATVTALGWMQGNSADDFGSDEAFDRAMLAQILFNIQAPEGASYTVAPFTDVSENDWFALAVNWCAENALVTGMGDGTYLPYNALTMEQMAQVLYNYIVAIDFDVSDWGDWGDLSQLDENQPTWWAEEVVAWALEAGMFDGLDEVVPQNPLTRAQVAVMLANFAAYTDCIDE